MPANDKIWGITVSETELNPHEAVPAASRQGRSGAGLRRTGRSPPAGQLVRAEPAATSPAIRGTRDAQLASLAGPARAYPPARSGDRWNPAAGPHRSNRSGTAHLMAGCVRARAHADERAPVARMLICTCLHSARCPWPPIQALVTGSPACRSPDICCSSRAACSRMTNTGGLFINHISGFTRSETPAVGTAESSPQFHRQR